MNGSILIFTPSLYADFLSQLAHQSEIALDTEADSLHCYFEKLCLIQIAWPGDLLLLDPLANLPLSEFFQALQGKRLIFHDADYDLRLLRRSGSFPDDNIFDTMIAARLCGEPHLGLAALVEKYFHITLSKASRKANWAKRPLSSQMVDYALNDVRYLHELAALFEEKLHTLERLEWFHQSRDRMIRATREVRIKEEEMRWRISGYVKLSPRSWAVLRALWQWRDAESRKSDKPSFYIFSNEEMLRIAESALHDKNFIRPKLPQARKVSFEEMLQAALSLPEEAWPKPLDRSAVRSTKQQVEYVRKLKDKRDYVADQLGLDPSIIASKLALELFVRDSTTSTLLPWQRTLLEIE
ncbi:MAG: ribonuclease D [Chthoniobacterales bacterium]